MTVLLTKNTANNTIYGVQELQTFYKHSMELHLMELHSLNCCLNTYANAYACYEKYSKYYYVYCARISHFFIII